MAENKDKKVLNVPALRFPGFTEEWETVKIGTITKKVGSGVTPRGGETVYRSKGHPFVRSQNVGWGRLLLNDIAYIDEETHKKQLNTTLELNDVLLNITGASIGRCAVVNEMIVNGNVNQHVCIIRSNGAVDSEFLCNYLLSNYGQKQIESFQVGGNRQGLNFEQIKSIRISIPTLDEQKHIAKLLCAINQRIETQNKIIEKLETLIKGIRDYVLNNKLQNITKKKLGELCTITTGKLDANAMKSEGLYPFFTCAEEVYRIDSFAFDTEALLVSGNGANLGYIHYYKGKFNAYQRTYVLSNFIEDIHYIQIYLEAYLHKRIALEKSTSNTPYIVLATLAEMPIIIPNIKIQKDISNKILILKSKLITEIHIRNCYKDMRQFLLSQMFI